MKIVKNLMHTNVCSINSEATVLEAYKLMEEKGFRHLPVLSAGGRLVGMLSDRDVKKAMMVKKLNEFEQEIFLSPDQKVLDFMSWPVATVSENTTIKLVAEMMIEQKISALIIEDGHSGVAGIITTEDLLAFIVESLKRDDKTYQWPQLTLQYYLASR